MKNHGRSTLLSACSSCCWIFFGICIFGLIPKDAHAQVGIANKYVADQGIGNDPAVVFAEPFEDSPAVVMSRFTGGSASALQSSTDIPAASGGTHSMVILPNGSSGTLYKQLATDYTQLFVRAYIKYAASHYHHSGVMLGGYYPPTSYPQGDAGLKGIRPNGDRLIVMQIEPNGGSYPSTNMTHIGTYANWIDMQGTAIGGYWWGRDLLVSEAPPIQPGIWQCVEVMMKMNSTASSYDGELALWINGTLVQHFYPGAPVGQYGAVSGNWTTGTGLSFPGFQWRDVLTYGLNWVKLQNYDDQVPADNILVDDLVVATQYIGPLNKSGADTTPPAPPSGLRILP